MTTRQKSEQKDTVTGRRESKEDCGDSMDWIECKRKGDLTPYYVNQRTKEKRYEKPLCLASPEEKVQILAKRERTKEFFKAMENNLTRKLIAGREVLDLQAGSKNSYANHSEVKESLDIFFDFVQPVERDSKALPTNGNGARPSPNGGLNGKEESTFKAKTISSLDLTAIAGSNDAKVVSDIQELLPKLEISKSFPKNDADGFYIGSESKDSKDALDSPSSTTTKTPRSMGININQANPLNLKRRNSTGTMYVTTTMMNQNDDATIRVVCTVLRGHMIEACRHDCIPAPTFDIFYDDLKYHNNTKNTSREQGRKDSIDDDWMVGTPPVGGGLKIDMRNSPDRQINSPARGNMTGSTNGAALLTLLSDEDKIPAVDIINNFFSIIFRTAQLESECIIIALIYMERLLKETNDHFVVNHCNWRSVVFICLVVASKVWDDLSMWNSDFGEILPDYNLERLNALELCLLEVLKYNMKVPPAQYAKYYFIIRSLINEMGLTREKDDYSLQPLDLAKANKLMMVESPKAGQRSPRTLNILQNKQNHKSMPDFDILQSGELRMRPLRDRIQIGPDLFEIVNVSGHSDGDGESRTKRLNDLRDRQLREEETTSQLMTETRHGRDAK
jgi:hypothetical protein